MKDLNDLLDVMHKLRTECPWDKEQTLDSLRTYLIEEAYECIDAMSSYQPGAYQDLVEELGDVLLQVIFQAEILSEIEKKSIMPEIIRTLTEKLIRRHPHIFGDLKLKGADQVIQNWEKIKSEEKAKKGKAGLFSEFKLFGPALASAHKIGALSARVQFDWSKSPEVWNQLELELQELREAKDSKEKEEELGDVLFCLAQWARHENLDPEIALQNSCRKFIDRFRWIESKVTGGVDEFKNLPAEEKERLWRLAKESVRSS